MEVGDPCTYIDKKGVSRSGVVVRKRGGYKVDVVADGIPPSETQMVPYVPGETTVHEAGPEDTTARVVRRPFRLWVPYVIGAGATLTGGVAGAVIHYLVTR